MDRFERNGQMIVGVTFAIALAVTLIISTCGGV